MSSKVLELARPGIERALGQNIDYGIEWPRVSVTERDPGAEEPIIALRIGMAVHISARAEWLEPVEHLATAMHPDLLFSSLGCYDLSRITLSTPAANAPNEGTAIWGPVPHYLADREMWKPVKDSRPRLISETQIASIDFDAFWHCASENLLAAFGIFDGEQLRALATIQDHGDRIWEIGVDVAASAQGRGLGTAVVTAAGNWVLDHDGLVYATAASWNVPSARNLRALGMEYAFGSLVGHPAPFRQPPQPLGKPAPGATMVNRYPQWAMNHDILEKPAGSRY